MKPPSKPDDDARRLEALRRYDLPGTPPDQALDDLAALAAHICETPIAVISFLDEKQERFKTRIGLLACEIPRDISFGDHAILQPDLFIVPAAAQDERFADNPLVTGEPHIRFYAGAPLVTPEGQALGTLCVMDRAPRELNASQQEALRVLSRQVMAQLELGRQTREMTGSQARFRALIEQSHDGIVLLAADGAVLYTGPSTKNLMGYRPEELHGRNLLEFLRPDWHETLGERLAESLRRPGVGISVEGYVRHKDGRWRFLEGVLTNLLHEPSVCAIVNNYRDITERREAEAALRASESKFRAIIEASPVPYALNDEQQNIAYLNSAFVKTFGYCLEDIPTLADWWSKAYPDAEYRQWVAMTWQARLDKARETGGAFEPIELSVRCKDGTHRTAIVGAVPMGERFKGVHLVVLYDITERKQAEAARDVLLDLESSLSAARDPAEAARCIFGAADKLWAWDAGALDVYLPDQDCTQAVLSFDIVEGERREVQLILPIDKPTARFRRIMQQGGELILRKPPFAPQPDAIMFGDTSRPSASILSVPIRWQGRPVGVLSIQSYTPNAFTDKDLRTLQGLADHCGGTLERIRADVALRASEKRFRELAETIQEVFWITDPAKNQMLYVSPAYEKIWGRTCASLYESPRTWLEAIHPDDRAQILHAAQSKQACGDYDETYRILRPDGTVRWIHDRAFPVRGAAGEILRIVGTAEDITERRHLEERFRQSQKMEAIGQLAGGIAHDFNNILAAILGNVDLALADTAPDHGAKESLAEIKKASGRAKSLVQQILAFSRQQSQERCVIALAPIIEETVSLLRASIPAGVELVTSMEAGAPPVLADPTQMHQVLVNLCTNAWHACDDQSGRIEIKLQSVTLDADTAGRIAGLRPGHFASLSVSDTGKGMGAATLERIFDPFFTTKGPGRGTGLGLSVVHGIVQEHDGALTVVSRPGRGSTFQIYLPAATAPQDASSAPESALHRGEGQRILYLDDEEPLVFLATRMLERLGYRITGFTRAADAMKAFRENPDQFDLVITDLNMPGTSGLHVAGDLLKLRPDTLVVLSSGHITEELRQQARNAGIREVLHKPNSIAELSDAIHRLASETRRP